MKDSTIDFQIPFNLMVNLIMVIVNNFNFNSTLQLFEKFQIIIDLIKIVITITTT